MLIGNQAGLIGLLTVKSMNIQVLGAVVYNTELLKICELLKVPTFSTYKDYEFQNSLFSSDLLLSVHGREIIDDDTLHKPRFSGVNLHPCLNKYKGRDPIEKLILSGDHQASVGAHFMTNILDSGNIICEIFQNVEYSSINDITSVYNQLYYVYSQVIIETINILQKNHLKSPLEQP
jgi:methionyl-tRNA formyltransferase